MARALTVLEIVSRTSMEIGIQQVPLSQALGSQDEDVVQLGALLSSVADDVLMDEHYQDVLGDGMWVLDKTGTVYRDVPKADDDIILIDGRVMINGLKWKFLQAKGLEFGEQMREFVVRLNKLAVRNNNRTLDLDMDEGRQI